jgi:hypothetical protein
MTSGGEGLLRRVLTACSPIPPQPPSASIFMKALFFVPAVYECAKLEKGVLLPFFGTIMSGKSAVKKGSIAPFAYQRISMHG